ncbi:MAG: hypothetical protein KC431_07340, partial [Myxococcales bacterium]|nr:hypothetical protein [Myxococcales bacterium]
MFDKPSHPSMSPIAVVGLGALFPDSPSPEAFWQHIVAGDDLITDVPPSHWLVEDFFDPQPGTPDKVYVARGGFLGEVPFAPLEFGMPPNTLPATDTAQLLALVVAKRVLEDALGTRFDDAPRSRISVILGVASATELVGHMAGRLQTPTMIRAMRSAGLNEEQIAKVEAR